MAGAAPSDIASSPGGEAWDLENLAAATGLCDWMFSRFADRAHGSVLEVGAGIGTFSERLLASSLVESLLAVEPELQCAEALEDRFEGDPRVEVAADPIPGCAAMDEAAGGFDFALCQNVLEHIPDQAGAVGAIADALRPGGTLGILVPAHPRLFGRLDEAYGHQRRYTRRSLEAVLEGAGLEIEASGYFNALGIPGWWVKNRFGSNEVDARSLRAYEVLLRAWRPIEDRLRLPFGLSVLARARKPGR
jgi:SAM-dependent methyltransferase